MFLLISSIICIDCVTPPLSSFLLLLAFFFPFSLSLLHSLHVVVYCRIAVMCSLFATAFSRSWPQNPSPLPVPLLYLPFLCPFSFAFIRIISSFIISSVDFPLPSLFFMLIQWPTIAADRNFLFLLQFLS